MAAHLAMACPPSGDARRRTSGVGTQPGDGVQPYLTYDKMAMACSFATARRMLRTTGTIRAVLALSRADNRGPTGAPGLAVPA
jgi:hypothetical protein